MNTKKIIAFVLSLIICFSAFPVFAQTDTAYDSQNRRYFTVYENYSNYDSVYQVLGCTLDHDGYITGDIIPILSSQEESEPCMAYDNVNLNYMLAWMDSVTDSVYGTTIDSSDLSIGQHFEIYDNPYGSSIGKPAIAFDAESEKYLVVWQETREDNKKFIYGQLINSDGSLSGECITISDESDYAKVAPSVASNGNGEFLVVWEDYRNNESEKIYAQLVTADGTLAWGGANVKVSSDSDEWNYTQRTPAVVYDNSSNRFLIVFENEYYDEKYFIVGQFIDNYVGKIGDNFRISESEYYDQMNPTACFDSFNEQFLVAWEQSDDDSDWQYNTYGRFVTGYDTLESVGIFNGYEFNISGHDLEQRIPSIAYNSNHSAFLISYATYNDGPTGIGIRKVAQTVSPELELYPLESEVYPGVMRYDLYHPELHINITGNGNRLLEVLNGNNVLTRFEDNPEEFEYIVDTSSISLYRNNSDYNKYKPQDSAYIRSSYLSTLPAGSRQQFSFYFDNGDVCEFVANIIDTSSEDTEAPTVTPYSDSTIPTSPVSMTFSEKIHEYSRNAIVAAIESNVPEQYLDYVNAFWNADDKTLVIENYSGEEIELNEDISVDLWDYAGNVTTSAPIIEK